MNLILKYDNGTYQWNTCRVDVEPQEQRHISATCYDKDDAAFIVKACNAHDELVAALSDMLADRD